MDTNPTCGNLYKMIEAQIIHVLLKRQVWQDYSGALNWSSLKQQTPEVYKVLLTIKQWHEMRTDDLTMGELPVWFGLQYPGLSDKQKEIYAGVFEQAKQADIRDELLKQYLQQLRDTQIRRTIAVSCMDDKVTNEKVQELSCGLSAKVLLDENRETEFVTTNLDDLIQLDEESPGLTWRLGCLNRSIGPIRKGMFGCVLARVETGKTALWVSEMANFLGQLTDEEHAVIFFNEENGTDVMWRLHSAITGMTAVEIESNPKKAKELFNAGGGQRLRFVDRAALTPTIVYKVLDMLNPKVIVIDNLDKVKWTGKEDRKDVELGFIYAWARETSKIYAPVIGVSQASGDRQKKWLTEFDMMNSKTAKPGELDFLIAIGKIDDAGYEFVRYINIPKNKRRANRYSDEKDRHGKFQTIIVPELSLYKDC